MHLKEVIKVAAGSWPAGLHGKHKEVEGGFPRGPVAKTLASSGEGNGNPLQCSCLENPWDGGACWAAVYGVTQSRTRLK